MEKTVIGCFETINRVDEAYIEKFLSFEVTMMVVAGTCASLSGSDW